VVIDSKIYRGAKGLAGEVGHIVVDPQGTRCSCGDVGCLETVASSGAIVQRINDRLGEGVVSTVIGPPWEDSAGADLCRVLEAAEKNDRLARSTLYETGEHIGNACAKLIKLLNPQKMVITGPASIFKEYFKPRVEMMLERHVMPEMLEHFELHFADYADNNEAIGVAMMSLEDFWNKQLKAIVETSSKQIDLQHLLV
jgi:transcriptional regulator of PTS gene